MEAIKNAYLTNSCEKALEPPTHFNRTFRRQTFSRQKFIEKSKALKISTQWISVLPSAVDKQKNHNKEQDRPGGVVVDQLALKKNKPIYQNLEHREENINMCSRSRIK